SRKSSSGICGSARRAAERCMRFAFWSGEEWELNGSTAYVANLSAGERKRIAAYLNFDMIASPNHVYGLFGGNGDAADGSALPGDAGARIRRLFTTAYEDAGVLWMLVPDERRSDHAAFAAAGIPFGGLFTGGEELKTDGEARRWGGTAGAPYDPCYHQRCDGLSNLNVDALEVNARVVASAVHALAMAEGGW
ncbi:MAG: M28 family peptidase, partial [Comamonadaceae bacterium]